MGKSVSVWCAPPPITGLKLQLLHCFSQGTLSFSVFLSVLKLLLDFLSQLLPSLKVEGRKLSKNGFPPSFYFLYF